MHAGTAAQVMQGLADVACVGLPRTDPHPVQTQQDQRQGTCAFIAALGGARGR